MNRSTTDPELAARLERLAARRRDRTPDDEPRPDPEPREPAPAPSREPAPAQPAADLPSVAAAPTPCAEDILPVELQPAEDLDTIIARRRHEPSPAPEPAASPAPMAPPAARAPQPHDPNARERRARGARSPKVVRSRAASAGEGGRRRAQLVAAAKIAGAGVITIALVATAWSFTADRLRDPERVTPADPRNMVMVPAAHYTIGGDGGLAPTIARQRAFAIDRFEVRVRDYAKFLVAEPAAVPLTWVGGRAPRGQASHPVVGVSQAQAAAYCEWAGKRLPSESEWEIAARGPESSAFPWGARAADGPELPVRGTYPVGSMSANRSAFGVFDAVGNASEWVGRPAAPVADGEHVLRGGSNRTRANAIERLVVQADEVTATTEAGFRCAADAIAPEFRDDFDDPASGWPEQDSSNLALAYTAPSHYTIDFAARGAQTSVLTGVAATDLSVEVVVSLDATSGAGGTRYGLTFRSSARGAYAFVINDSSKEWELLHISGRAARVLRHGKPASLGGRTASDTLRVEAHGDQLDLFVNEIFVDRVVDRRHADGDVGLFVRSGRAKSVFVSVDRFAVRTDGAPLAAAPAAA